MTRTLPAYRSVLVVCAHPDDESFGLGAVLSTLARNGSRITVLCFTHGEASTLGSVDGDLATIRASELATAGGVLGVSRVELLDYPDGALTAAPIDDLAGHVHRLAHEVDADLLLVFDRGGITGHPDHQRATDAALASGIEAGLTVLAWALPAGVTEHLNREFGTGFVGRTPEDLDLTMHVDRDVQRQAIRHHQSQSNDNPVLWRRLALLGDTEHLRYLNRPSTGGSQDPAEQLPPRRAIRSQGVPASE